MSAGFVLGCMVYLCLVGFGCLCLRWVCCLVNSVGIIRVLSFGGGLFTGMFVGLLLFEL